MDDFYDILDMLDDDGSLDYDEYLIDVTFGMTYEDYLHELELEKKELM